MSSLPRTSLPPLKGPFRARTAMNAPARHYEFVVDVGEAMGIASAIHRGRLADVIEHLCLDHVADQLGSARSSRLVALIAVDRCRRPCRRCEQAAAKEAARAVAV
jgi:hypothetical protein